LLHLFISIDVEVEPTNRYKEAIMKCAHCGKESSDKKFCSKKCKNSYHSKRYSWGKSHGITRRCNVCNKTFIPKAKKQKYCSHNCSYAGEAIIKNKKSVGYGLDFDFDKDYKDRKRIKLNGRWVIKVPEHPFSYKGRMGGYVYEHRLIIEQKIKKFLPRKTIVHHIDGNKHNNNIDNLQIMPHSHHTSLHKNKDKKVSEHFVSHNKKTCIGCNKYFETKRKDQQYCSVECMNKKRSEHLPDKITLKNKIIQLNGNFARVGKEYGVTDNAVRKWCKKYGLSDKSMDWRNK